MISSLFGRKYLLLLVRDGCRVEENLVQSLFVFILIKTLVVLLGRFSCRSAAAARKEFRRQRKRYFLLAFRVCVHFAIFEPVIAHSVQVNSAFVVYEQVEIVLVQLCHLAFRKEITPHLFRQFNKTRLPDFAMVLPCCGIRRRVVE